VGHAERREAALPMPLDCSVKRQRCFPAFSMTLVYKAFDSGACLTPYWLTAVASPAPSRTSPGPGC
nr:hypothetical protein [Tanacetum cinerariifolium]